MSAAQNAGGKTALCLSGGGYRATAFHLGVLWRLNELGHLARLDRIAAVSGGALVAGCLAVAWRSLEFTGEVASNFNQRIVAPIRKLLDVTIGTPAYFFGLLPGHTANGELARYFQEYLCGGCTLRDLPARPDLVFCATDLRHGTLWTFDKHRMGNPETGWFESGTVPLATAIAASAAFPLILAPARLDLRPYPRRDQAHDRSGTRYDSAILTDGGVYDDLALDPVSKKLQPVCGEFSHVLISDADEDLPVENRPGWNWLSQIIRVRTIAMSQMRLQRLARARAGQPASTHFGLTEKLSAGALVSPRLDRRVTNKLLTLPTLFVRMNAATQADLINWGYAICAAKLPNAVAAKLPYPES